MELKESLNDLDNTLLKLWNPFNGIERALNHAVHQAEDARFESIQWN
jgi:hypothetical protein